MALNPIMIPLYASKLVFDFYNDKLTKQQKEDIIKEYPMEFMLKNPDNTIRIEKIEIRMEDEYINAKAKGAGKLNKLIFFDQEKKVSRQHRDNNITIPSLGGLGYLEGYVKQYGNNRLQLNPQQIIEIDNDSNLQYRALFGVHFMNRLILMNKFDVIKDLYKYIANETINKYIKTTIENKTQQQIQELYNKLLRINFKGDLLKGIQNINKKNLTEIILYDYYLTPLEGIYINENIIGLIKFLAEKLLASSADPTKFIEEKIKQQPKNLNFQTQQIKARLSLISENIEDETKKIMDRYPISNYRRQDKEFTFTNQSTISNETIIVSGNRFLNSVNNKFNLITSSLEKEYNNMKDNYKSDAIFSFDQPLIQNILTPYLQKVDDYKIFYLFGNYGGEIKNLKCEHQYKLLENTKNFIDIVSMNRK